MGPRRGGAVIGIFTMVAATVAPGAAASLVSAGPVAAAGSVAGRADAAGTVWLCRPGQAPDPCARPITTTVVPPTGVRLQQTHAAATTSPFDCFYAYPTVSTQAGDNANLAVQAGEVAAAFAQASPFSQLCRVWAPVYRQRTEASLAKGLGNDPGADQVAYQSLLAGWDDYLAHDNDGRPFVLIGHSQGAAMLIRLIAGHIDTIPRLRRRMVSAVLLGGNVTVPTGKVVGTSFTHVPLCTASGETGCVIAYSTFPTRPPAASVVGRPGQGVSLQAGQTARAGVQVACVDPAALGGGTGALVPWFPTRTSPPPPPPVRTPWVVYPSLYTAACRTGGGASWLQVDDVAAPGDHRPVVSEVSGPRWGYHVYDVNLATGNLLRDVQGQEAAYLASRR